MSQVIREAVRPYLEAQLNLIKQFSRQSSMSTHRDLCSAISEYLESEYSRIRDQLTCAVFLSTLKMVGELLSILRKTVKQEPYWCLPLIKQCYELLGITFSEHEILIVESKFHFFYKVKVNLVSQYKILDHYRKIHKANHGNDSEPKEIDIFTIPFEMKFDLASLALLGHEVAHVYFSQRTESIKQYVKKNLAKNPSIGSSEREDHIYVVAAHVEEYLCDETARQLFGPAFDFALLLHMHLNGNNPKDETSLNHPPNGRRMQEAMRNLENYKASSTTCQQAINNLKAQYFSGNSNLSFSSDIYSFDGFNETTKFVFETYESLYSEIGANLKDHISPNSLGKWWDLISPTLDDMLPPIEYVNMEYPVFFSPIHAQIITTLYYYYPEYRNQNNEFFEGENRDKLLLFREKLTGLLRYAITIYDFVEHSRRKRGESDMKAVSNLKPDKATLWAKRDILKVVPTTSIQKQYSAHGVDLRLGMTFITGKLNDLTHISLDAVANHKASSIQPHFLERYFDYHTVPIGKLFTIHPHTFVLASTLEYVSIPPSYYALVLGRSSWGRLGLNIATATAIGSGFKGCITLELRNLGETPLQLKIGTRICQITLVPNPSDNAKQHYSQGANKYIYPTEAEIPNLENDDDLSLLENYP